MIEKNDCIANINTVPHFLYKTFSLLRIKPLFRPIPITQSQKLLPQNLRKISNPPFLSPLHTGLHIVNLEPLGEN